MFSKLTFKHTLTALLLTLFLAATLSPADAQKGPKGPHKGKPPIEAFEACADQTEAGAACSFDTAEGDTVEGTCMTPKRNQESLVCKPSRDKKRRKPE